MSGPDCGERVEVEEITDAMITLPLKIEPSRPLILLAMDIAIVYGITVYDAIYISLAKVYDTAMMTADRKLIDALARTDLRDSIIWLGSYK